MYCLGNTIEYRKVLLDDFNKALGSKFTSVSLKDVSKLTGVWELKGFSWEDQDVLEFDGVKNIKKSKLYKLYEIPKDGILSLWSHHDAMPKFGVKEDGLEEHLFYAHWVKKNTIHLLSRDSSLQWLLVKRA